MIMTGTMGPEPSGGGGWVRSKWSTPNNNCVEARFARSFVCVRDSKDVKGGMLSFGSRQWRELLVRVAQETPAVPSVDSVSS